MGLRGAGSGHLCVEHLVGFPGRLVQRKSGLPPLFHFRYVTATGAEFTRSTGVGDLVPPPRKCAW